MREGWSCLQVSRRVRLNKNVYRTHIALWIVFRFVDVWGQNKKSLTMQKSAILKHLLHYDDRFDKNYTNFIYGLLPNENQIALFISLIQIRSIIEYKFDILGIIFQVLQILRHRYKKEYRTIIFYEYFSFGRLRKNYLITKEENIILDFLLFSNYTNNDDLY